MSRSNYNRYELFINNEEHEIVPGIKLPIKSTDKFKYYKKGKDRLDKISEHHYGSPTFGWLIMTANPDCGLNEHEINDNYFLRIPFPLLTSLQDYKQEVELYKLYYGK